ncbi:MAG: nucleotidyltransferase family protein, partial [Lachnospiraceae bacterium]|nr:nucleotidyltransferase family protein [Lachnospiraceae bacterium]
TLLFKEYSSAPWLRILGFRKDAVPLLSRLKKNADAPLITKTANYSSILSEGRLELFEKHLQTAELYRLLSQLKSGKPSKNEFTNSIIMI